ncbi:MAG: NUDIX hydrolase [Candidatus Omnitrophica bacterium]|nr:NUDIX hydrolase [Candidatus Omnitrophota bacterium]
MGENLSFRVKKRKVIFSKGPIHLVDCDVKMKNGRILSRQILEHPGSVVLIPLLRPDKIILVRQFRFAIGKWIWELPAGGVERGESLKQAAIRELKEEIHYRPRRVRKLASFYPTPGISGEMMHLFLAEDLVPGKAVGDDDEELKVRVFSLAELGAMIKKRKIKDAKTVVGYFCLERLRKSKQS